MSSNLYELISIGARYLFAALMVIIVIRAWRITIVDSRRANHLRRLSPETGVCGEFLIITGGGKVREGMRFPVIREGMIGSSGKADIRLRCQAVHRTHAFFEMTENGLRLRTGGSARMYNGRGEAKKDITLSDGSRVTIGQIELMLILTEAIADHPDTERDTLFDLPDDYLADMSAYRSARRQPQRAYDFTPAPSVEIHTPEPDTDMFEIPSVQPVSYEHTAAEHPITGNETENIPYPDDLFMDDIPTTLKPDTDDPWDDTAEDRPVKVWDDWEDAPAKPKIKRKKYDDPFDI